jgi:hypothetical protein
VRGVTLAVPFFGPRLPIAPLDGGSVRAWTGGCCRKLCVGVCVHVGKLTEMSFFLTLTSCCLTLEAALAEFGERGVTLVVPFFGPRLPIAPLEGGSVPVRAWTGGCCRKLCVCVHAYARRVCVYDGQKERCSVCGGERGDEL